MMVSLDHNELTCFFLSHVLIYKVVIDVRDNLANIKPALVGEWYGVIRPLRLEAVLTKIKQHNINGNMLQYYS